MSRGAIFCVVIVVIVFGLVGVGIWWRASQGATLGGAEGAASSTDPTADVAQVPVGTLSQTYQDSTYRFSVNYPAGYTVQSVDDPDAGGTTILIQQNQGATLGQTGGIQIFVSPWSDSDTSITPDRIEQDIPDMTVNNPQEVDMAVNQGSTLGDGQSVGKGLAFESNNAAFGGASREVWFVFNGNLYQISTYLQYNDLLKAMLGTWKFF